jgi:ATP-binding cassette subfamily C protein
MKITFRDIYRWGIGYKKELLKANIFAISAVSVSLFIPLLIPYLIDEIILKKPGVILKSIDYFFAPPHSPLFYILVTLLSTILLRAIYLYLSSKATLYFSKISKNITFLIQKEMIEHLKGLDLRSFEEIGSSKINSLFIVDVATIDNFLGVSVSKFIVSILSIIGIGSVLLWIDFKLGLFILLFMPVVVYFTKRFAKRVGRVKREENRVISSFSDELTEGLDHFWQLKASNEEDDYFEFVKNRAKRVRDAGIEFKYKSEVFALISYFLFLAGFEIFRSAGIISVEYGSLTIGKMLAIFGYLWVIMSPFQEVLSIQYAYHSAKEALNRINTLFDLKKEKIYPLKRDPFKDSVTNSLRLKDVSFSYRESEPILRGINIEAKRAQKIAIVGESGGGKSTLAQLIVGFFEPDSGDILYDSVSYKEIGFKRIRDRVYLVLQQPMLFNKSIRYNLTFGKDIDDERLFEALKVAKLQEYIKNLPNGVDTKVGRDGVKLSGGERQRLSIARMVLSNPNIVILDESTSSLDTKTEEILFDNLSSFLKERTTIIIAHRLSTVTKADRVYLIEDGEVKEEGSYMELLERGGKFSEYVKRGIRC